MMRVFLIAGELSGDKLGAALMAGLRQLNPDISFAGVGGAHMQSEGLESRFAMDELSVMGIAEILPKYWHLKRRIAETADAVVAVQPDVLITIDSPDFCLRVARLVKQRSNIRVVHYVAPSVWAWRAGRAQKMARYVDQVLALLPFEPPYMQAVGMRCDFVGHPVAAEPAMDDGDIADFRDEFELGDDPVLLVLPGSRASEIARLTPVFGAVVVAMMSRLPNLRVVVPAAAPVAGRVVSGVQYWPGAPIVLDPRDMSLAEAEFRKRQAFGAADVALAASGTVSLELAAAGTAMVIAYDMNWLSWQIMSRMAKIDTVTLVNLVTASHVVPEFLGPNCRPGPIADAVASLLDDPDQWAIQIDAMNETMSQLGRGGQAPGMRAAYAVLDGLKDG